MYENFSVLLSDDNVNFQKKKKLLLYNLSKIIKIQNAEEGQRKKWKFVYPSFH